MSRVVSAGFASVVLVVLVLLTFRIFSYEADFRQYDRALVQSSQKADANAKAIEQANKRLRKAGQPTVQVPTQTVNISPPMPRPGQGPAGPAGIPGQDGVDGQDGTDGRPGLGGPTGPPGPSGQPGVAIDGRDGGSGPQGLPGKDGSPGPIGPTGLPGPTGVPGEQGKQGDKGDKGEKGDEGKEGKDGENGRGIKEITCNEAGELLITYTDDTTSTVVLVEPCEVESPPEDS